MKYVCLHVHVFCGCLEYELHYSYVTLYENENKLDEICFVSSFFSHFTYLYLVISLLGNYG